MVAVFHFEIKEKNFALSGESKGLYDRLIYQSRSKQQNLHHYLPVSFNAYLNLVCI